MAILPKIIREDFARAKGYLRRNEVMRAMETMSCNLRACVSDPNLKHHSNVMATLMYEFLNELSFHPKMKCILDPKNTGKPHRLAYTKGKEIALATALEGLAKILHATEEAKNVDLENEKVNRLQSLIDKGEAHFEKNNIARGSAYFNRAAAEFGKIDGVYMDLAHRLSAIGQYPCAAGICELCIEKFPGNTEAYIEATEAYYNAKEYKKAEEIYLKILKQFGGHANTFGKMAKLYLAWSRKYDASDYALRALQLDAKQADALKVQKDLGEDRDIEI